MSQYWAECHPCQLVFVDEATYQEHQANVHNVSLRAWWLEQAGEEIYGVEAKAIEYGAADLEIMGVALARLLGHRFSSAESVELAIAFYELGKIARAFGAYAEGRMPSDDTWDDMHIYAKMVKRIREVGTWPGRTTPASTTNQTSGRSPVPGPEATSTSTGSTTLSPEPTP